jgi:hypothetical protein
MDRILTRKDHEGNAVVFLPDTLKDNKLMAWYGQSNAEPVEVTIDYYKSTSDLEEKEAQRLKKQYEKVYGNGPVFLMQRFPRGFMKALKEQKAAQIEVKQLEANENKVEGPKVSDAEKSYYRAVKAVRVGKLWEVQDEQGETLSVLVSKEAALAELERATATMH